MAVGLNRDFFHEEWGRGVLLRFLALGLALLRAVIATEADAVSMVAIQDFDRIAVEDRDDRAGEEFGGKTKRGRSHP